MPAVAGHRCPPYRRESSPYPSRAVKHFAGARRQEAGTPNNGCSGYPLPSCHPLMGGNGTRPPPPPAGGCGKGPEASTRTPRRSMLRASRGAPPMVRTGGCVVPRIRARTRRVRRTERHWHVSPWGTSGTLDASNLVWIPRTVQCGRPLATTLTTRMSSSGGIGFGGSSRCSASKCGHGGEDSGYSEARMFSIVVISCCWVSTILRAMATASGFCPVSISVCAISIAPR